MRIILFFLLTLITVGTLPAAADARGYYTAIIDAGRERATANSYAAACRADLSLGGFLQQGDAAVKSLHAAISDCRAALHLDPDNVQAILSYAIALSFESKRCKKPAIAKLAKKQFERLLATDPDNAMAHGAFAGWHSAVAESGFLARLALGASRSEARSHFEAAGRLLETDLALQFEYLKFLALGNKDERERAQTFVEHLMDTEPENPLGRLILDRVKPLKAALEDGGKKDIEKTVKDVTAFAGIEDWRNIAALEPEDVAL